MGEISARTNMLNPQPPPQKWGSKVGKELINYVWQVPKLRHSQCLTLQAQIEARTEFGKLKYGQPLMTRDGRDEVIDAEQELVDLIQYAYKARLNNRRKEAANRLGAAMTVLVAILTTDEDDHEESDDEDDGEEDCCTPAYVCDEHWQEWVKSNGADKQTCPPTPTDG